MLIILLLASAPTVQALWPALAGPGKTCTKLDKDSKGKYDPARDKVADQAACEAAAIAKGRTVYVYGTNRGCLSCETATSAKSAAAAYSIYQKPPCAANCAECTATACTQCRNSELLINDGVCVSVCPADKEPTGKICNPIVAKPKYTVASWEDFKTHTGMCCATWAGAIMFGVILSAMRHRLRVDVLSGLLQPVALCLQESKFYLGPTALLSLMMCVFYLLYIGSGEVMDWTTLVEDITCYIHAAEVFVLLLFNSAQSQEEIMTFAKTRLFTDCFVVVSVLGRGKIATSYFSFSFCAALRVRNNWMAFEHTLPDLQKGLKVQLMHEAVQVFSRIFVFAALMGNLESFVGTPWMHQNWESWETATSPTEVWTTSASIYFVLCTISTVGYGDMQPRSIIGQVLLMFVIVLGIGLVLYTVVKVVEIFQQGGAGGGEYRIHSASSMRRHIVVAGTPCAQTLQELLEELYHDDHWAQAAAMDTVILLLPGSQHVMDRVRRWMRKENRKILGKVYMLQGSPLHWRDLDRAKLDSACMGLVLPNTHAADEEREDIENGMRTLSMHRHTPYVRLVALVLKVEFKEVFLAAGLTTKDVVCVDEMKLGIMGKACEAQGFIALVCNLFKSAGECDDAGDMEACVADYLRGMGNEIYETRLSACYRGAPFGEVAIDILKRSDSKAYMIGVIDESRYPGEDPIIRMHPGRLFRLGLNDDYVLKGIFIAPDREVIQQHPPDKPFSWKLGDKAAGTGDSAAPMTTLPGAVVDTSDILERLAQRWLPDPRVVKKDFVHNTREVMMNAAEKRTVQTLKVSAEVPRPEIEEILDKGVKNEDWATQDYSALEDTEGTTTDPRQKALLQQQINASRTQEKEKQKGQTQSRIRAEARMRKASESIARQEERQLAMLEDPHLGNEQQMDEMLWGGPQTPRKPLWGSPLEPPTECLIRGEHVVILTLEGNEDDIIQGSLTENAGTKLGLEHFMWALRAEVPAYAQRPVVVLAQRVPYDWPTVMAEYKDVYLITGRPLAEENLELAGIRHAKAVLIYQRGAVTSADPTLVDAAAIFATVLTESLLLKEGKDPLCIVDLNLHDNAYFVAHEDGAQAEFVAEELTAKKAQEILEQERTEYVNTRRFMSGQLFASGQAITSLTANMLYNPALGVLVQEMLSCRFVVLPMPMEFKGTNFEQLYQHMIRKRNLIAVALLRRFDVGTDEELGEAADAHEENGTTDVVERYDPQTENPKDRFMYTMPPGDRRISFADGVVCVVPKGDAIFFLD